MFFIQWLISAAQIRTDMNDALETHDKTQTVEIDTNPDKHSVDSCAATDSNAAQSVKDETIAQY